MCESTKTANKLILSTLPNLAVKWDWDLHAAVFIQPVKHDPECNFTQYANTEEGHTSQGLTRLLSQQHWSEHQDNVQKWRQIDAINRI